VGRPRHSPVVAFGFGGALMVILPSVQLGADQWGGQERTFGVGKGRAFKLHELLASELGKHEGPGGAAGGGGEGFTPLHGAPRGVLEAQTLLHLLTLFPAPLGLRDDKEEKKSQALAEGFLALRARAPLSSLPLLTLALALTTAAALLV
jgi:hypothetical protein